MKIPENYGGGFDLEKEMEDFARDISPVGKAKFFFKLKTAEYLVPFMGDMTNLAYLTNSDGKNYIPAFTSAEELMKSDREWDSVELLNMDTMKHILIDVPELDGIAFNPFGKTLLLGREQLAEIDRETEGLSLRRSEGDEHRHLSPVKQYPDGLKQALYNLFVTEPAVNRAWLTYASRSKKETPHYLFIIDFIGDRRILFPQIARVVTPFMKAGDSFELVNADEELIKKAYRIAKPIYLSTLN